MIIAVALAVAVLFGSGLTLTLGRDLFRTVAGVLLLANAVNLLLLAAGRAPVATAFQRVERVTADPLAQAMALTAIVITFGVTSLLLALVIRVHGAHGTIDIEELAEAERVEAEGPEGERLEV